MTSTVRMPNPSEVDHRPTAGPALKGCDLVMKGGITSGIVYPTAALELAKKYRFRSIGGTSAGAIAAALTAAAEYGRERGGFKRLAALSQWLGEDRNLFNLFQPSPKTKPLLLALLEGNARSAKERRAQKKDLRARKSAQASTERGRSPADWLRVLLFHLPGIARNSSPGSYWAFVLVGILLGTAIGTFILRGFTDLNALDWRPLVPALLFFGLPAGWILSILAVAGRLLRILTKEVAANYYGVCTGLAVDAPAPSRSAKENPPALTDWLNQQINDLAGRDPTGPPLTIGELKAKGESEGKAKDLSIVLRTLTTNLSQAQPYSVPFEEEMLLFSKKEMSDLFPAKVVEHLVKHQPRKNKISLACPDGFYCLPQGDDLPVVLAARLSSSFPVLLSAIPLYTVKRSASTMLKGPETVSLTADDLQRNWFSDGGIASNFPIHFFDVWLPTRPTFGINLTTLPEESFVGGAAADPAKDPKARDTLTPAAQAMVVKKRPREQGEEAAPVALETEGADDPDVGQAVYLPRAGTPQYPTWEDVKGLTQFLMAIWTTAQNYRDNTQSRLPSYRERIVQVRFAPDEGGLNLAMGPEAIRGITDKGRRAAELLCERFDFDAHRWVRFRVLMAQLEAQLAKSKESFPDSAKYEELLLGSTTEGRPFAQDEAWCEEALRRMEALLELLGTWGKRHDEWTAANTGWGKDHLFVRDAPQPPSILRVTPTV